MDDNLDFDIDFTNPSLDASSMTFRCLAAGGLWVTVSNFFSHPLTIFLLGIVVTILVEIYKGRRASRTSALAIKNAFQAGRLRAYEEMGAIPKHHDTPNSFPPVALPAGEANSGTSA